MLPEAERALFHDFPKQLSGQVTKKSLGSTIWALGAHVVAPTLVRSTSHGHEHVAEITQSTPRVSRNALIFQRRLRVGSTLLLHSA